MLNFQLEEHYLSLFQYAPISLWEEDFSPIHRLLDGLRQRGVQSLENYLAENPAFVDECMGQIKVINVNEKTLTLFKAASLTELLARLDQVFRAGMRHHFASELLALWHGALTWAGEGVNYTLEGEALDILLHWRILPGFESSWERVLVTIEDLTARKQAERRLEALFEASPISLWEEDYSALKAYFDELRAAGVTNLDEYLRLHPQAVSQCLGLIRVLNVNQKTIQLFGANSKEQLLANLPQIFRDEMGAHFARELVDLWNGKLDYEREGLNYALTGEPIQVHLDFRIMPGHTEDFGWALVAIQDISQRKKAEDYLRYLGTHDVMTGVYNRAYFEESLLRLEQNRRDPISLVICDLNGLKNTNDTLGHQAGDNLIRRAAEVLKANAEGEQFAARIGGDEFILILPGADEPAAEEALRRLQKLVELNNKYYGEPELSLSLGAATSRPGQALEKVFSLADRAMYANKAEHHRRRSTDY